MLNSKCADEIPCVWKRRGDFFFEGAKRWWDRSGGRAQKTWVRMAYEVTRAADFYQRQTYRRQAIQSEGG